MMFERYEQIKNRWIEYWARENHDRPIMSIYAPRSGPRVPMPTPPGDIMRRWCDMDYVIHAHRAAMNNTYCGCEAFPVFNPNLGPDILGAVCGCELSFGEDTSWAKHFVKDWGRLPEIRFSENNRWFRDILLLTRQALADAQGDYLVGVTDLHPGMDGLVSLRGPENLCMDLYDEPEMIMPRIRQVFDVYAEMFQRLSEEIERHQQGSTNWMGIWRPEGNWYVTSCDFSALVSEAQFEEFILPGIQAELEFLPASIYHLDGPGALRHLDRLLRIEKLNGIQWVPGAGAKPAREWISVYQRIQAAGKCIQASCEPADIEPLCRALDPEGLHLVCHTASESDARDLEKLALRACSERRAGKRTGFSIKTTM